MWERTIHYNLSDYLLNQQTDSHTNPIFGIFTCEPNHCLSTRLQSTRFLIVKDNGWVFDKSVNMTLIVVFTAVTIFND